MEVKQAIQASANVIRVTNITVGDVYKRYDTSSYGGDKVIFGIVKSVHNDGEFAVIEALEYKKSYSDVEVDIKILSTGEDYRLFPATPEDLDFEMKEIKSKRERELEQKEEEVAKIKRTIEDLKGLISGETQKGLKAMEYKELTQAEYNRKKVEAGL